MSQQQQPIKSYQESKSGSTPSVYLKSKQGE